MNKMLLLLAALMGSLHLQAQTTINVSFNKTDFCVGDSLVATVTFSRPLVAYYTGFYGITGTIVSGYSDYSQYNQSNASNGTIIISKTFLSTNDSVFKITVGDSISYPASTIENKYTYNYKVHARPIAYFTYLNPKEQCENRGMHFNLFSFKDSSICPPGSYIIKCSWYYGDGNADVNSTITANHSYNYTSANDTANRFIISVKVTDNFGCTDSTSQSGFAIHPVPVAKPTIAGNSTQCLRENLFNFIDSSFFVANTSEGLLRKWTFDANDSTFNATGAKHYTKTGIIPVKLVCFTPHGCGDTATLFVTVKPAPETLSISGSQSVIAWSAHNYSVTNTSGSTYNWSVNNGTVNNGNGSNSVSIQWNNALSGTVQVQETNADGCTGDSSVLPVQINPNSIGAINTPAFCFPNPASHTLTFTNPSTEAVHLKISSLNGEKIYDRMVSVNEKTELNVSELKAGIYLAEVWNAQYKGTQKIVIVR